MLFFGIAFVLHFFELSEKYGLWKTALIHFFRRRGKGGGEGSHDIGIIIEGGLLNDDA